ncbi:MAG TPA: universal stress protein [Myxococcota bacterium]
MHTPLLPAVIAAAVDLSAEADAGIADHIVDVAAAWAASFGARLVLLTACPPPPVPVLGPLDPTDVTITAMHDVLRDTVAHAESRLQAVADRARQRGVDVTTQMITAPGHLPELLAHAANALPAQLLILGTRAKRGLAAAILGSVAEKTAHLSKVPVTLLPPPPLA